jgi:hypothetical protein
MSKIKNKTAPPPIADAPVYKRPERFTFRATEHEHTYLSVGDVVRFQGREHVVESVNATAARIIPITEGTPKQVTFKPKFADKPVTFTAPERNGVTSISANSELDILRRLGHNWRERL